jgi:hypothetical protein
MGNFATSHIVGGTEAKPHQFPWQVGIFMDASYFCGGSIICEFLLSFLRIKSTILEDVKFVSSIKDFFDIIQQNKRG